MLGDAMHLGNDDPMHLWNGDPMHLGNDDPMNLWNGDPMHLGNGGSNGSTNIKLWVALRTAMNLADDYPSIFHL